MREWVRGWVREWVQEWVREWVREVKCTSLREIPTRGQDVFRANPLLTHSANFGIVLDFPEFRSTRDHLLASLHPYG